MSKRTRVHYFSIGESPERHATVWRLWTPHSKADVYLGARFVADRMKLSIHESGLRLVREKARAGSDEQQKPATHKWYAPPRNAPGLEVVWQIITPFGSCREAGLDEKYKTGVQWLPQQPRQFTATQVEIVLSYGLVFREGEFPLAEVSGTQCLLRWRLANGETLFLLHRTAPLPQELSLRWGTRALQSALDLRARSSPEEWKLARRKYSHRLHIIESVVLASPSSTQSFNYCADLALDV